MTKTNKRLLTLLFAAFMAICAGFALLLARPASSASAEETTYTVKFYDEYTGEFYKEITVKSGETIPSSVLREIELKAKAHEFFGQFFDGYNPYIPDEPITGNGTFYITYLYGVKLYYNGKFQDGLIINEGEEQTIGNSFDYLDATKQADFLGFAIEGSNELIDVNTTKFKGKEFYKVNVVLESSMHTVAFTDGETALGTVEAIENAKLSALDTSAISTVKEGYTFKGWSLTSGGEVIDLDTVTVTGDITLYAVYEKNADPSEPTDPTDPTDPENPNDPSFEDKVKDFGEKASTWIKDNIGITLSGSAVIIILIVAALVIVFKRK